VTIIFLLVVTLPLIFSLKCREQKRILRLSDNSVLSFNELINDVKSTPFVLFGEFHDWTSHHRAELQIVQALHEQGIPVAIGMEMFQADKQQVLDSWIAGDLDLETFIDNYYRNWNLPWPLYRDIFLYAHEHSIPIIGLHVERKIVQQVAEKGFSSLSRDDIEKLPGVSCNVDEQYRKFIRTAFKEHGKDDTAFTYFCEAQMVWDTTMAWNILQFKKNNPQYTVFVIAGNGHSWKQGIPEQIRQKSDLAFSVILPEMSHADWKQHYTLRDTDYLWLGL
jgi:uncharacterized iron-regulated protein